MGYTEVDQKAINTIRLLAVCFFPLLFLPRHCPSIARALPDSSGGYEAPKKASARQRDEKESE